MKLPNDSHWQGESLHIHKFSPLFIYCCATFTLVTTGAVFFKLHLSFDGSLYCLSFLAITGTFLLINIYLFISPLRFKVDFVQRTIFAFDSLTRRWYILGHLNSPQQLILRKSHVFSLNAKNANVLEFLLDSDLRHTLCYSRHSTALKEHINQTLLERDKEGKATQQVCNETLCKCHFSRMKIKPHWMYSSIKDTSSDSGNVNIRQS